MEKHPHLCRLKRLMDQSVFSHGIKQTILTGYRHIEACILRKPTRIARLVYGRSLPKLATLYHTDKWNEHWYAQHYQAHFAQFRRQRLNILEIGIGGYEHPLAGGESLRMWKAYFPNSHIYGIDLYDKTSHEEDRITTFQGSQGDVEFLEHVASSIGPLDIIIDDGSHYNEHVVTAFKVLFPTMSSHGIYAIEDVETSYWEEFGGTMPESQTSQTTIGYMKNLIDGLNYAEYKKETEEPTYFDTHIMSLHFYHNLLFIHKGLNTEGITRIGKALKGQRKCPAL